MIELCVLLQFYYQKDFNVWSRNLIHLFWTNTFLSSRFEIMFNIDSFADCISLSNNVIDISIKKANIIMDYESFYLILLS